MTNGTSIPPKTESQARKPSTGPLNVKTLPLSTLTEAHSSMGSPSISGPKFAPVMAILVSSKNSILGPKAVISSPAAISELPIRAFAVLKANESIAPDTGTPKR